MSARWQDVGEAVRLRRLELGLRQTETTGVSASSWRNLEGAKQTSYKPFLLRNVERCLGWAPGTIDAILAGTARPVHDEGADVVGDRVAALEARLARLERELGRLRDRVVAAGNPPVESDT